MSEKEKKGGLVIIASGYFYSSNAVIVFVFVFFLVADSDMHSAEPPKLQTEDEQKIHSSLSLPFSLFAEYGVHRAIVMPISNMVQSVAILYRTRVTYSCYLFSVLFNEVNLLI